MKLIILFGIISIQIKSLCYLYFHVQY